MDWRQNMGVKKENEHLKTYPQYPYNPQYSNNQQKKGSFTDITDITDKDRKVKNMDEEDRYCFEERAAIMEFDGSLSREDAEKEASRRARQGG